MVEKIPVFKPLLEHEEKQALVNALDLGWLGVGSYVGQFEDAIASLMEVKDRYVVSLSTGHAALHLGLMLLGVGPGDEVITPSFNNTADFQAIKAVGAEPVFCDILDSTLCIDPDALESLISSKTKAIIMMDYACHLCDFEKLENISAKYSIPLLHDAAHSFGSFYKGRPIGSFSHLTMFSFDPIKNITCIDGGALVVKSLDEAEWLKRARMIGMGQSTSVLYKNTRAWSYDVCELGYRYHMSNPHAALGLAQLKKLDVIRKSRQDICRFYNRAFSDIADIRTPQTDFFEILPFIYYLRVDSKLRDSLREYIQSNLIDTGFHWKPGHMFTFFKNCKRDSLLNTEKVAKELFSIPLFPKMEISDMLRVVNVIRDYFGKNNLTKDFIEAELFFCEST